MFCEKCGTKLPDDLKFCTTCGAKLNFGVQDTDNVQNTDRAKGVSNARKGGMIIGIVGCAAVALGALFIWKQMGSDSSDEKKTYAEVEEKMDDTDHKEKASVVEESEQEEPEQTAKEITEKPEEKVPEKEPVETVLPISSEGIVKISASSYLTEPQYNVSHIPERVSDGDLSTAWVESASGQGIGETIWLEFDKEYVVSGMTINAGYQKNDDIYYKNSRPREVYIGYSDGSTEYVELQDINGAQTISFSSAKNTTYISLTIQSVYAGNKYEDTAISEIKLY